MTYLFKSEIIDYNYINNHCEFNIIFLHGWGGNKNSFITTINLLKHNYNILTITMPTIANTTEIWTLTDYVNLITNLITLHSIKNIIIICHSFGFRVATILSSNINIKKIVVTGGAGLKKCGILKRLLNNNKQIWLKKNNHLYNSLASTDYKQLSDINKQTFKHVVNVNTKHFVNFNCPILLFWGKQDKQTPLWMARHIFNNNNAKLIITKNGHFAYLDNNTFFNNEVLKFLK